MTDQMHLGRFDFGSVPSDVPEDQSFAISLSSWSGLSLNVARRLFESESILSSRVLKTVSSLLCQFCFLNA
jgi:hypothetical protein